MALVATTAETAELLVNALNGLDKDGRYTNTLEESIKAAYHVSTVRPSPIFLALKRANKAPLELCGGI